MNKLLISLFLFTSMTLAIDIHEFENETQRQSYIKLTEELRCPVCQNQNIADSDAGMAEDFRDEVANRIQQGQSEQQIIDFMVQRYGDFITYNPPMRLDTIVLWALPLIIFLTAAFLLVFNIRKNQKKNNSEVQS
jgi:cytochrome c-type biogenesis protein CcmH